ncbi:pyridoxamine 5'-phosphate oxidase family protein [Halorientalis brevis]|uniref:Pyridoxamine 5'-phosphate oxidase family protein n=1 Tax=Halorientalis brevis TaxID=1126241 RepID=A0ABD6CI22_9EURY|nr:pyridoxamine 5'-phosphate oxidase family protein [Halorientalis brevis]
MQGLRWVQMTQAERDDFLGNGGIGVLSFSTPGEDPPWLLPVSYGYDVHSTSFYFSLAFPPDTGKPDVIDNPVSFATHSKTPDGWRSIVATGTLEEVTDMPYDSSAVQGMWAVNIPEVDIFDQPREEITFRDFHLEPDALTGRKEVNTEP